jgi:hypothetical protein
MNTRYEVISLVDRGDGENPIPFGARATLSEAFDHLTSAGDYIVAVENGTRRPLTDEEEQEYSRLLRQSVA